MYNLYLLVVLLFSASGGQTVVLAGSTVSRSSSSVSSFRCSDLEIVQCPEDKRLPKPDWNDLVFGAHFADHMFEVQSSYCYSLL